MELAQKWSDMEVLLYLSALEVINMIQSTDDAVS